MRREEKKEPMNIEELYRTYFDIVYRYIHSVSQDGSLAEEVTQETFFKALKKADQFRGDCDVRVWLCQIAKNKMRRIIFRHALKPALLPVLSYMGPAFVGIITGSMVIETIYGLPGIGQLFVNGALNRDYSLVLSLTILVGALTILFNAFVDVLYAVIDPKIRY